MLNVVWRRFGALGLVAALVAGLLPGLAWAHIDACGSSVSPSLLTPGADTDVSVRVTNISGPQMAWIQVVRPNADYTVTAASLDGWTADVSGGAAVFRDGSLGADGSKTAHLTVHANAWASAPANWAVRASDSETGAGASDCSGARSTSIGVYLSPDGEGTGVSGVAAETTATTATVHWDSDTPTGSGVTYGKTSDYGASSAYDETLVTHHVVALSGLSPQTGYHFQVGGLDADGGAYYSGDSTFSTGVLSVDGNGGSSGSGGGAAVSGGAGAAVVLPGVTGALKPTETVPPVVTLTTRPVGAYKDAPVFRGEASDNDAVAAVEYSVDGGKTWSVVSRVTPVAVSVGTGKKKQTTTSAAKVAYEFTPVLVDDGNYKVMVRATDASGNRAVTPAVTLVIDRLPPRPDGAVLTTGAQVMVADGAGRWPSMVGVDQGITLGAVGGPIEMKVEATRVGRTAAGQSFALQRDDRTGLWNGILSFSAVGAYHLAVAAVDGAGNRTTSALSDVVAAAPGRVTGQASGLPVLGAKATLYAWQPDTSGWARWNGGAYGQNNPALVKADGTFGLVAPAGKYYLQVEAAGYRRLVTRVFTLERPTPIVPRLELAAQPGWRIGSWTLSWPWEAWQQTAPVPVAAAESGMKAGLVGQALPAFSLPTTNDSGAGADVSRVGLLGKPTVVSVVATWSPAINEQLPALATLQADGGVNVVPLVMGERVSRVRSFLARGGYSAMMAVDVGASLSEQLGAPGVPTHYLVDRNGIVQRVLSGVQTVAELKAALDGL